MDFLLLFECAGIGSIIGGTVVFLKFGALTEGALMAGAGALVFFVCEGLRNGRKTR